MASVRVVHNKDGSCSAYVRITDGCDLNGDRITKHYTFKGLPGWSEAKLKKEALKDAERREDSRKRGVQIANQIVFQEYCEYVIRLKEENDIIKHSTAIEYKALAKKIYPEIGRKKVRDILPTELTDLYSKIMNTPSEKTGKCVSKKTISNYSRLISTVLEQAYKEGIVEENVSKRATLPLIRGVNKEKDHFSEEELKAILEAMDSESLYWKAFVYLLVFTGARRGEIYGLKWSDIDFEKMTMKIQRTVNYSSDRGIYEDSPKSDSSNRVVDLPPVVIEVLKQYKQWQNSERLRLVGYYEYKDIVFANDCGNYCHPDNPTRYLKRLGERHPELPKMNPHKFRHSYATMLVASGLDIATVSKELGHADITTTLNFYTHAQNKKKDLVRGILTELLVNNA